MSETNICVVGLGYVGLPTALAFHNKGFKIYGVDVSDEIVEKLRSGKSHLVDSSAKLRIPINDDSWKVSSEFHEAVGMSDVVLITVPTPVNEDKSPDFGYVEAASHSVLSNLDRRKRTVVVLESTVFPGITRRILGGICEKLDLTDGKEVVLAYCPERVSPGEANFSVESVARVVGCDDEDTGRMLASLYGQITDSSSDYVGKLEVAEASKMVENLQRDIDIALANELSIVLPRIGVDVEDVLDAADTKWNFHRHTPGIGVGGHCIPVDPYYYISLARSVGYESILSITARSINENMPMISVDEIQLLIGGDSLAGKRVLVLGYSYKPNVGDIRETPIKDFIKYITEKGGDAIVWDPLIDSSEFPNNAKITDDPYQVTEIDAVILATAHEEVLRLDWERIMNQCNKPVIYDGRRVLEKEKFTSKGWIFSAVGMPIPEGG